MTTTQSIVLKNLKIGEAESLPDIIITSKEKQMLGRSQETMITAATVSREHLLIKPKFEDKVLLVRLVGKSPASINGFVMIQDEAYEAVDGDIINFVFNSDYQYRVTFDDSENEVKAKRRSQEDLTCDAKRKKSQEEGSDPWASIEKGKCIVFTSSCCEGRSKIAAYDMDNTIIKTVSGLVFPKNIDDWQLNYSSIPNKLKTLHANGFKICVFTNQAGIESGKTSVDEMKRKIFMISQRLSVPCQFFMATGSNMYRKPRIGMWKALVEQFNDDVPVDMKLSFYVGDAAGRPEVKFPKKKKDHSSADRLFAMNLNLSFYTPEEHFLNEKDRGKVWIKPAFNPSTISDSIALAHPDDSRITADSQEVILMVGFPASGKSFFCKVYLKPAGYEIVNRDTLGTQQKCLAAIDSALKRGKSVVIDNTNPDPTSRKRYIETATKLNIPIRCFHFTTSYEQSRHNNKFRELTDTSHAKINDMIFHVYKNKFVEPDVKEGFSQVLKVNFVPKFERQEHEDLYKMYLLER